MRIIIAGAGGTGGWFIPQITKYLSTLNLTNNIEVYIYDFDHVELKNLSRQNFIKQDISRNKAEVMVKRYSRIASDYVHLRAKPLKFPDPTYAVKEFTIVFSCVDTIQARANMFETLSRSTQFYNTNAIILDAGNSLESGQITAAIFKGETSECYVSQTYVDILNNINTDVSTKPNALSCADIEQQTFYINQMQANNMLQFMQYLSVQSQIGTDNLAPANILSIEHSFDNLVNRVKSNKVNSIVETGVITTYDKEFIEFKGEIKWN